MVSDSSISKNGYMSLILNIRTSLVVTLHDRQTSKQELSLQNTFHTHTPLWTDTNIHIVLMLYVFTGFQDVGLYKLMLRRNYN